MARRIISTSSVCIMEGNGGVSYDFLTIGLKGGQMVPLTQETSKPIFIQVFSNLVNAQLSK
jgi:hypothetical protein